MTARDKDYRIADQIGKQTGRDISTFDANTLRRAEMVLRRWAEQECGDSNEYASWSIERDEQTGRPYRVVYPHSGGSHRAPIADRERGALRRVNLVCGTRGLYWYHQTDPRGCALYVAAEPLDDSNYSTKGVAVC